MAIPVNPPNMSALAALAGRNVGNLGLRGANFDVRGLLSAIQAGKARDQQNQQFQQEMALKEANASRIASMQEHQLNLADQEMALKVDKFKQDTAFKQQQLEMARLLKEDEKKIQEQGAFASYARLSMDRAETPEEAFALKKEIIQESLEKGYIDETQAKQLNAMPISRFNNALDYKILQLGKVNEYNKMKPKESSAGGGTIKITRPDGSQIEVSEPTKPVKTQTQKDLMDRDLALQELGPIRRDFNKNYFTYKGQAGLYASKMAEKARGIPGLEQATEYAAETLTSMDPEERKDYIQDATKYLNAVEQFFQQRYRKPITGAQAAVEELKQLRKSFLSGDMSPSEFQGALDNIMQRYVGEAEYKTKVLREGINVDATRKKYKELGWSDEQIDDLLKYGGYK